MWLVPSLSTLFGLKLQDFAVEDWWTGTLSRGKQTMAYFQFSLFISSMRDPFPVQCGIF